MTRYDDDDREESVMFWGTFIRATPKAMLIRLDDTDEEVWFPLSQMRDGYDPDTWDHGEEIDITIPRWLAEEKGLA